MANYAIIKDNKVLKVIVADSNFITLFKEQNKDQFDEIVLATEGCLGPGQEYRGKKFIAPPPPPDTRTYAEKRRDEYPSLTEAVEAILETMEGNSEKIDALIIRRAEIKSKYPKPDGTP